MYIILYPIVNTVRMLLDKLHYKISDEEFRLKYIILVGDVKQTSMAALMANIGYMVRRYLMITVIIWLKSWPFFQIVIF